MIIKCAIFFLQNCGGRHCLKNLPEKLFHVGCSPGDVASAPGADGRLQAWPENIWTSSWTSSESWEAMKVQSVLPARSADEVTICALVDVGGGTHFLEAHLHDIARDGHIRTMSNIPKDEYWAFWKSLWWCWAIQTGSRGCRPLPHSGYQPSHL